MKLLEEYRKNKEAILTDMRAGITFHPERDRDILGFMEQYIKAEPERRPKTLEYLLDCINGKEYPNPYADSYHYTDVSVNRCEEILDGYIDALSESIGDPVAIKIAGGDAMLQIEDLNKKCGECLLDTWRRDKLSSFISGAAGLAESDMPENLSSDMQIC